MNSRFIKGRRQDALAEIEGWITEARLQTAKVNAAKNSQPAKNVTEQKMLTAKLYDMSRQRFNFMSHCRWQRKLFIEKQKKKTTVMQHLFKNVDSDLLSDEATKKKQKSRPPRRCRTTMTRPIESRENPSAMRSTGDGVFITEHKPQVGTLPPIRPVTSSTATLVNDTRFLRLSQSLCDNYPKMTPLNWKSSLSMPASPTKVY